MNPSGKWSFLIPVTLAAASLLASAPAAAQQPDAAASVTDSRAQASDQLVLQVGAGQPELNAHSSHYSHASHASHASHRSHYSSR
jgi:hypothetical protein